MSYRRLLRDLSRWRLPPGDEERVRGLLKQARRNPRLHAFAATASWCVPRAAAADTARHTSGGPRTRGRRCPSSGALRLALQHLLHAAASGPPRRHLHPRRVRCHRATEPRCSERYCLPTAPCARAPASPARALDRRTRRRRATRRRTPGAVQGRGHSPTAAGAPLHLGTVGTVAPRHLGTLCTLCTLCTHPAGAPQPARGAGPASRAGRPPHRAAGRPMHACPHARMCPCAHARMHMHVHVRVHAMCMPMYPWMCIACSPLHHAAGWLDACTA